MSSLPPAVDSANLSEARGDWSGLKGNYYHVLYAAWLALSRGQRVTFFAGNDLYGRVEGASEEEWIQLKNTDEEDKWTIYTLVRDQTLLATLIRNALTSEVGGRKWTARLVTPAEIDSDGILKFLRDPQSIRKPPKRKDQPPLPHPEQALQDIIETARAEWQTQGGTNQFSLNDVRAVTRQVLQQVADSPRVRVVNLERAIEAEVKLRETNPAVVRQVISAIVGAVAKVSAPEGLEEVTIDAAWLASATGQSILTAPTLISDVLGACAKQVAGQVSVDWSPETYVDRPVVGRVIDEFRQSPKPLMVLVGESGVGKSWALAHEALTGLRDSVRALLPADRLLSSGLLVGLHEEFAPYVNWTTDPESLIRHLLSAASNPDVGPLTIFADDLGTHGTAYADAQALVALAKEAAQRGIKVVVSMRYGVWHRLNGSDELPLLVYIPTYQQERSLRPSLELISLTNDEVDEFVRRRQRHPQSSESLIRWLQRPEHLPLRNAYLLRVFLDQFAKEPNATVAIEALLDEEIERRAREVADRCGLEPEIGRQALRHLVDLSWRSRPRGVTVSAALVELELVAPGQSANLLREFRARDVLAPEGSLKQSPSSEWAFANPLLLERALARALLDAGADPVAIVRSMVPGVDDGVVTMMARGAVDAHLDVLTWAEQVRALEPYWTPAICLGLAHRPQDVWRILGYLTAIANEKSALFRLEAMRAIGTMAYHSAQARAWIVDQYNDPGFEEAFLGRLAVGAALGVHPEWAVAVISDRVLREISWRPEKRDDLAKRGSAIRRALDPLEHLDNREAAAFAARLLRYVRRLERNYRPREADVRANFDEAIDSIRGAIAAFGRDAALYGLARELGATRRRKRIRAARAARITIFERPDDEDLRAAMLDALARETQHWIPFLSAAFLYAMRDGTGIAAALDSSGALRSWRGSLGLVVAGLLAQYDPAAARSVLPTTLLGFDDNAQMLLREPLAFAWMLTALADPDDEFAKQVLKDLSSVDRLSVQKELACFAYRGAAIATLGLILLENPQSLPVALMSSVAFHHLSEETGQGFVYIELDKVCKAFAASICAHPDASRYFKHLTDSVSLAVAHPVTILDRQRAEWQFRVENLCSDEFAALEPYLLNRLDIARALPQDWHALRICRAAVESGMADEPLLVLGCEICRKHYNVRGNVSRDRDAFLFEIERRGLLPERFSDLVVQVRKLPESNARHYRQVAEGEPKKLLEELHERCMPRTAVEFTWDWTHGATDWRPVLLGHVFRHSLLWTALDEVQCLAALDQLETAIGALPASPLRDRYLHLTARIRQVGKMAGVVESSSTIDDASLLGESLTLTDSCLNHVASAADVTLTELVGLLGNGKGYLYDPTHWIADGTITFGWGQGRGTLWIPPLPRLALSLASIRLLKEDFIPSFTTQWHAIAVGLASTSLANVLGNRLESYPADLRLRLLSQAKGEIEALIRRHGPWQRLLAARGQMLLMAGDLPAAELHLKEALLLPPFGLDEKAAILYNLACVHALSSRPRECRELLQQVATIEPKLLAQAPTDQDLVCVHGSSWFRELALSEPSLPPLRESKRLSKLRHLRERIGRWWRDLNNRRRK